MLGRFGLSLVALCMLGPLMGCVSYPVVVGPRRPHESEVGEKVSGSACGLLFWGMIPIRTNSRTQRAYDQACGGSRGGLVDTHIRYSWYTIPALGLLLCSEVEGRPVR